LLFVNDNSINPDNTLTMLNTLDSMGVPYGYFNAVDSARSPSALEMQNYKLVLWYMSSDGVGRYFWNATDSDNPEIIAYLQGGGRMVAMGTDFLYDRYSTPTTFVPGDFMYDYMGTSEYHAQSYGDDGGLGVAELDTVPGNGIVTLNPVQWVFSTLWWVDACLPAPTAQPVYQMGPPSYVFSNYYSAIANTSGDFHTMAMFFDPALIDTQEHLMQLLNDIVHYYVLLGVNDNSPSVSQNECRIYPNPTGDRTTLMVASPPASWALTVTAVTGQEMIVPFSVVSKDRATLDVSGLAAGIYLIRNGNSVVGKVQVVR
jgi:hypothetical protein